MKAHKYWSVGALITMLGKRILKKHFEKAGITA